MKSRKGFSQSNNSDGAQSPSDANLLDKLSPEEAMTVLRYMLEKHPELRSEAQIFGTQLVSSSSIEDIAEEVHYQITSIDLENLNERAGAHSWGYVEPTEAAFELLQEAVEDLVTDMQRKAELGLGSAAEVVCVGIVEGLYQARHTESDGALGWAPDFPSEQAHSIVEKYLQASRPEIRNTAQESLMKTLATRVPQWAEGLKRTADRALVK